MGHTWANDTNHLLTMCLKEELMEIKEHRERTREDPWIETHLCYLDEEVVKGTYDETGTLTNIIDGYTAIRRVLQLR